jgi:hypothetical protein
LGLPGQPLIDQYKEFFMKRFSTGTRLITGLMLILATGTLMAQTQAASYVKSDVDFSTYTKVLVKPLNMDNIEVIKPAWEQDSDEEWSFDSGNREAVQSWFMEAMKSEIEGNGGYPLVTESGDDVIRIEVELLSITPYVKPGTQSADSEHRISTLGSGDVVISAEFRDSTTRELLVLVEGERAIGEKYREVSQENHIKNIKAMFTKWGKKTREALDRAHGK